jgi:hypothetical protein
MRRVGVCAVFLVVGACAMGAPGGPPGPPAFLPATPYPVRLDGDPREAFLLGAEELVQIDAISGHRDGSVRAYALATKEGL